MHIHCGLDDLLKWLSSVQAKTTLTTSHPCDPVIQLGKMSVIRERELYLCSLDESNSALSSVVKKMLTEYKYTNIQK